jgi:hypothetical protein
LQDIGELRALTDAPFGVNVFSPPGDRADSAALERYAARLQAEADRYGVQLGTPRHDDDDLQAKLNVVVAERVEVVSFTFGCPQADLVARLHDAGCDVWVTVTGPQEAIQARDVGADALVVQGLELVGALWNLDLAQLGRLGRLRAKLAAAAPADWAPVPRVDQQTQRGWVLDPMSWVARWVDRRS